MVTASAQNSYLIRKLLTLVIAFVWLINGLACKILNLVPRHQLIVARILGEKDAWLLTQIIGVLEVLMFIWIISGIKRRWNALVQVIVIASMNLIEAILAPDLLLFGRINAVFATIFIVIIITNEFLIRHTSSAT